MDLAAMSEAKVLVLASSLLCAKKTSLRPWILSCGKNNGLASTMAAIMSLACRSSRRISSPPTGAYTTMRTQRRWGLRAPPPNLLICQPRRLGEEGMR
ncbi:Os07g0296000 [Oryza sativa Japonica Group]|uniref:Os07g0296000 protein n=1 Tax=Oryza sativa subsp. japonica TaxID=39947 RepID=A0A0P0X4R5_ORYSJ|nr:hypothetical protein EE612_038532 [Oryza sativa]BAT01057.1 Os07g0296000 [Oryza sativa Japonica Group]